MKKQISLALAAALLLALTACSGQSGGGQSDAGTGTAGTAADGAAQAAAPAELPDPASVTMEEQVLVDEAGIKMTATKLEYHPPLGFDADSEYNTYHLAFTLENNTDQTLRPEYSVTAGLYNGSTTSFSIYPAVEAGSTYADSMGQMDVAPGESRDFVLYLNSLEPDAPVQWAACFAFYSGEFSAEGDTTKTYLLTDLTPIKTSATDAAPVPRLDPVELFGPVLYEDDSIALYARNIRRDTTVFPGGSIDTYGLSFCCQNKTDQWLFVQWKDTSINGTLFDNGREPTAVLTAAPQSLGFSAGMTFEQKDLDDAGINTLESLAEHLTAYTADALHGEGLSSGAYRYTLPDGAQAVSECDVSLDKTWIDANYSEHKSEVGT